MAFHLCNGLFFERQDGNFVRIFLDLPPYKPGHVIGANPEFEVTVDAGEWASVVASVAARGEDGATWREALDYHTKSKEQHG